MKKELQLKKSLAQLGHGKWKSALGCTLLMIGLLMGGMNAWGQTPIPDALKLDKKFIPDDETGHSGKLWIETYTTGNVTSVHTAIPTDFVCVLDVSNSMTNTNNNLTYTENGTNYSITRMRALQKAMRVFIDLVYENAVQMECEHRMAVVSFRNESGSQLLTTPSVVTYSNWSTTNYQNALVNVVSNNALNERLGTDLTGGGSTTAINSTAWDDGRIYEANGQGTQMNTGLNGAASILNARSATGGGGATFTAPDGTELPRNMVVVFFTDGYPTTANNNSSSQFTGDNITIAGYTYTSAQTIKGITINTNNGSSTPIVYSIGCNGEAAPNDDYKATASGSNYVTGTKCFNGLLHMISSDFSLADMETGQNWQNAATTYGEGTLKYNKGYYFGAQNANSLITAFQSIGSSNGGTPVNMGASTIVQDVISASFKLPADANVNSIKVYAPKLKKLHRANADSPWLYDFTAQTITVNNESVNVDTITGGTNYTGRLVLDTNTESETYGYITDSTYENRINSSDVLTINGKTLCFKNFDFKHYYCGPHVDNGDTIGYRGRKLVMVIPIEIEEGVWGDGINTNGELSFVTPNDTTHYQFPQPIANVLGDVWTEIVQYEPDDFDPMNIDSPEDLAWFISYVNGRAGYEKNNQIGSHPNANGKLTADIDMSAHNWVPIGSGWENANGVNSTTKLAYNGTFDGNGHVITGLKNNASKYYKQVTSGSNVGVVVFPGMFSNVTGTVKNVFVLDADFRGKHHDEFFVHHGIIADTLTGGTIFNCEAVGRLTCNNDQPLEDMKLVYGGLVGFNDGGTIHSSMAMATLTGYSMGGLVGENDGTVANSFTNPVFNYIGTANLEDPEHDPGMLFRYVGGLVGRNHHVDITGTETSPVFTYSYGTIDNCYVRFQRTNSLINNIQFGQLVGSNMANEASGEVTNCYWPYTSLMVARIADETDTNNTSNYYTAPTDPTNMRLDRSNDNMVGGTYSQETYTVGGVQTPIYVWHNGTTLVDKLNGNIPTSNTTWSKWKRTTAGKYSTTGGDINDDYPVLKINGFNCVASTDGIALDYATTLDEMLERHNTGVMNNGTALPNNVNGQTGHNYYVSQTVNKSMSDKIYGGAINLYVNDNTTKSTSTTANTMVYIDENISLLQSDDSNIDAYTSQNIIDYGSTDDSQSGNRWHNVSSSLSNSMFGWDYGITEQVEHNWDSNPCDLWLSGTPEQSLFPIDMQSTHPMDFYCFYEPEYHWVNFKRNSLSHWHMDDYTNDITYTNEDHFIPGKGYLMALHTEYFQWGEENMHLWTESESAKKDRTLVQNRGTLNNGEITIPVTADAPEATGLKGYNLLGNPYQSFLDFSAFANATENAGLWEGSDFAQTCAIFDPSDTSITGAKGGSYVQYIANASKGAKVAGPTINMHQGFFIQVAQEGTATFTNAMRTNDATPNFRGEQPAYPLINFILTDNEGETDIAVLELNRPENDGARKLRMGDPAGRIYFRYDDTNLAIYFRNSDKDYQTLNFAAEEDGNFTLNWNTANADFRSLTLVDNVTGIKTDMLTHDHYTFEGRVDDYNSRFKIVFGEMDNNEEEPVLEHFAFFDHGNLIVNGTGHFEVVDVMGRVLYAVELTDTQNTVSLPSNVRGVCMLCFTRNNETKVQKMVIQ